MRTTATHSLALAMSLLGCAPAPSAGGVSAPETAAGAVTKPPAATVDPMAVQRDLEAEIQADRATAETRRRAYTSIKTMADDGSAAYAYARAAVTGRLAETRGLGAGKLVAETEYWARASIDRDPDFHDHAAQRLLGTLYVLAPARLVEHGDSEVGLEILETLVEQRPEDPRNRLRLAEAYVALGDPEPAIEHLCFALVHSKPLTIEEGALLGRLVHDVGGPHALGCPQEPSP